ncbi:MAG: SEL1-like repeat protein [Caulobacter sp.]
MSNGIARTAVLLLALDALGACATSQEARRASLGPLQAALTTPPETLRARADRNDASAQLSLSLLYEYGQGGVARDPIEAYRLRKAATASRGSTPITTYIAGLNGKPGRVSMIFVPRYDVAPYQATVNVVCSQALDRDDRSPEAVEACGGEVSHAELAARWRR